MKKDNYCELLDNTLMYYNASLNVANKFGGPSIYFHQKALEWQQRDFLGERHLEYVYAMLASWGMHRMGKTGAKMPNYNDFKESILSVRKELVSWKDLSIEKIDKNAFDELLPHLQDVCFRINASKCDTKLVSSSKTLAHILPNLVCPMDREYTLTFFYGEKNLTKTKELKAFNYIMQKMWDFYHEPKTSIIKCEKNKAFCESLPKIFDNMIIAYKIENNNQK